MYPFSAWRKHYFVKQAKNYPKLRSYDTLVLGANPTIVSYNTSIVKIYNATGRRAHFERKIFTSILKERSCLSRRWSCKLRSRRIGPRGSKVCNLLLLSSVPFRKGGGRWVGCSKPPKAWQQSSTDCWSHDREWATNSFFCPDWRFPDFGVLPF
jgi:hypothetical protein